MLLLELAVTTGLITALHTLTRCALAPLRLGVELAPMKTRRRKDVKAPGTALILA